MTHKILVVDDLRDSADSLALLLGMMGHEVRTAYDGDEALDAAQSFLPDVVLLDIGMPRMDGIEACQRLRSEPWGRDIVIIAQTGWGQEDHLRRTQAAGFDLHLTKPFDPELLLQALRDLMATRARAGA